MTVSLRLVSDDGREALLALSARVGYEAGLDPYEGPGDSLYWLVEADGVAVGFTGVHTINWVSRRCRGSLWIAPEHRRKGYGSLALTMRNALLFDSYNMNRIEWAIATDNGPMLAMSPGQREGVARQVAFYGGQYHDYALYALVKGV